jgi:outer membrane protein assembly factor BamB
MRHVSSHEFESDHSGAPSRTTNLSICQTTFSASRAMRVRNLCLTLLAVGIALLSSSFAQLPFTTSRGDNARDGANTNETILTPSRVNVATFGHLFSVPVDYVVMAQPLFMPNVSIPGQGTHNVVYVVTQADSVYALDADTGASLWTVNFTNPAQGIVLATKAAGTLPCGATVGFDEEGIPGTPVIDPTTNTIYLIAKTVVNGTVEHNLHALDITTGKDQPGSPVLITAQSTSKKGHVTVFNSKYQKNRPGLLLLNGVVYAGFGSNSCNGRDSGWVLAYNAASLTQVAVFNTSPDHGLTSIWQTGNGLAADEAGNIFVETAESGINDYDVPQGGETYCNSVVKLSPTLEVLDYFTPWSVAFLNSNDLDLSSTGVLILPDQTGPNAHELVAAGKEGMIYVLDRDNMGMYSPNDSNALQELPVIAGVTGTTTSDILFSSPAYWNGTVYFAPDYDTPTAFPVSSGVLGNPLPSPGYNSAHSPSVSANGNSNGVLWFISGPGSSTHPQLVAMDAVSLGLLYTTIQAPNSRDALPAVGHFVTQTVTNGKVYVATRGSLEAYGLLNVASVVAGNGQSATVGTPLGNPIQVQVSNPYSGQLIAGTTVTFSDGCIKAGAKTCGSFNPQSAITDGNGNVSTIYTVPKTSGTYTLTIAGTGVGKATASATATSAAAVKIVPYRGTNQTGAAGSNLPIPLTAQAQDAYGNGAPGITINFAATKGAVPNPPSGVSDPYGLVSTILQLPTTVGKIVVTASSPGFRNVAFNEYSVAGLAVDIDVTGGNNQTAPAGTQLPQALTVLVTDQYGNPVSGNSVTFSDGDAGGSFSNPNPVVTGANGVASEFYTLPSTPGTVAINAAAAAVANAAAFTETGQ